MFTLLSWFYFNLLYVSCSSMVQPMWTYICIDIPYILLFSYCNEIYVYPAAIYIYIYRYILYMCSLFHHFPNDDDDIHKYNRASPLGSAKPLIDKILALAVVSLDHMSNNRRVWYHIAMSKFNSIRPSRAHKSNTRGNHQWQSQSPMKDQSAEIHQTAEIHVAPERNIQGQSQVFKWQLNEHKPNRCELGATFMHVGNAARWCNMSWYRIAVLNHEGWCTINEHTFHMTWCLALVAVANHQHIQCSSMPSMDDKLVQYDLISNRCFGPWRLMYAKIGMDM